MAFQLNKNPSMQAYLNQSVSRDLETYNKLKDLYDYLDLDKQALIRDPQTAPAGLRNLGNTCYLNVLLQVIYHINYLRDKICMIDQNSDPFLETLRKLFGGMCKGKMLFADPGNVFGELRNAYPDVFAPGIQNDFEEVYTLLIDMLEKSFQKISEEDKKAMLKLFYGKMRQVTAADKKIIKIPKFSVVNLDVKQGSFEKALDATRQYKIDEYLTNDGNKIEANVELSFVETPALMTFLINRVGFQNGQPCKDSRPFEFEKKIFLSKKHSKSTKVVKQKVDLCENQRRKLQDWFVAIYEKKTYLENTLKYLDSKEFNEIGNPIIENPMDQTGGLKTTKMYIEEQLKEIEKKVAETDISIQKIEEQKQKLAAECDSEIYEIFAVMIHEGTSAISGHYKVCINSHEGTWTEFNDRKTSEISYTRIQEYKARGEICCLFYRRTTLVCNSAKSAISASLKKQIYDQEIDLKARIDDARILQAMHSANETAGRMVEMEWDEAFDNMHLYFFKPNLHLICQGKSNQACRKAILSEQLSGQQFERSIRSKLFDPKISIQFPVIQIDLPNEYQQISSQLKLILIKETELKRVPEAYQALQKLSHQKPKDEIIRIQLINTVTIMFMKGAFYYSMFIDYNLPQALSLEKSLNGIYHAMNNQVDFLLPYVPILATLNQRHDNLKNGQRISQRAAVRSLQVQTSSYPDMFSKRFATWIRRGKNLASVGESVLDVDAKMYADYLELTHHSD